MKAFQDKIKQACAEIEESIADGTFGRLQREARERDEAQREAARREAVRRVGQPPEGDENAPKTENNEFRAPTQDELLRFTAAAVAASPQYAEFKLGLGGFELTIAILAALPGFVSEHLPWNPATAGI